MVDRHISVPGCFTGGDFSEWIQRFEICSAANEWDEDAMARKLPTLLEKEALVCWLDIPAETKKIVKDVKRLLVERIRRFRRIPGTETTPWRNSTAVHVCA